MNKETKLYWKTLFNSLWEVSKGPLGMVAMVVIMASWVPAIVWWTGFFDESDMVAKIVGTILAALGSLVGSCGLLIFGEGIWKALVRFNDGVKKKASEKIKKEKQEVARKLRVKDQRVKDQRAQIMQAEANRVNQTITVANSSEVYKPAPVKLKVVKKKQKATRKKFVKAVKSSHPKNRLEAVG